MTRRAAAISLTALAALVLFGFVLFAPNLEAVARRLFTFLRAAPTDTLEITSQTSRLQRYSDPGYFDLSLEQAEAAAGFKPLEIPESVGQTEFSGAHYDPELNAITLRYLHEGYPLYFTQRPLGQVEEFATIGASAPVESVSLRGVEGEYVQGGWRAGAEALQAPQPTLELVWDPDLPQHTLRWEQDRSVYEILAVDNQQMDKTRLLALAERVK
jgi:hypothetical protein